MFVEKLKEYFATVLRAVRSKTVLSAAAGFGVHFAVKRGWLPEAFWSSALEGVSYILCAVFRVAAVRDLKAPAATLEPEPLANDIETVGKP